jgi:hypothetical protein
MLLQRLQTARQRGLRNVQLNGGPPEIAMGCNGDEGLDPECVYSHGRLSQL